MSGSTIKRGLTSPRQALPRAIWAIAGSVVVMLLVLADRYGFHRDELYFVAAGRRLAWGYVDQPPLTPLIARLGDLLPGTVTPLAIRIIPALSAATVVVLTAMMARRFGGGRRAIVLAALFAAGGGFFLAVGHLLSTTTFDVLIWAGVLYVVVMLFDGGDPRWWLAVGLLVGIGMMNKYMIAALVAALALTMLASSQRRLLADRWLWLGGGIALLIAAPNLVWQQANGWPQLEMAQSLRETADGPLDYLLLQIAILSVALIVPAVAGWHWLWSDPFGRKWRPLAASFLLLFVVFLVTGGKGYYGAPLYLPLFAAGAIWVERLSGARRVAMLSFAGVGIAIGLFLALPLVPPSAVNTFNEVNKELGETYGWVQLVDQVEDVYLNLPAIERTDAVIFTANYGEAGAVAVLGEGRLPRPISGHNNYWLWGPGSHATGPIIGVGRVDRALALICPNVERVTTITNRAGVANDEAGEPIWLCRQPSSPLSSEWDHLRHYN